MKSLTFPTPEGLPPVTPPPAAGPAVIRTMTALKEATWPVHQRLEKRLAVKDRFASLDRYRMHLARLLAFYTAAEQAWSPHLAPALSDFAARRKAALLAQDLAAVGGTALDRLALVPAAGDTACALGCFYVLEGATLGGQYLLPLVERRLGLSCGHGASYLASYGTEVGEMWRLFGAAVQAHCLTPEATARAVAGAQLTFAALEVCLCE